MVFLQLLSISMTFLRMVNIARRRLRENLREEVKELYGDGIESGATKKGTKKESLKDFSSKLSHIKEGGHLLSRIALQYHRRRRA